jgi:hypothetical protein
VSFLKSVFFACLALASAAVAQPAGAPSAPASVVYYPATNTLAWSSPAQFGTGAFTAYQATANGTQIANDVVWSSPYTAPTAPGQVVKFGVRACNTVGCSSYAETSYASPGAAPGSPSEPGSVVYSATTNTLSWSSPASFGTGAFTEYRASANGTLIADGIVWSKVYAVPAGQTVTFDVRACNTSGCGLSKQLVVGAQVPPSAPTSVVYYPSTNTLSWSSPATFGNGSFTAYEATANNVQIANGIVWSASYTAPTAGQTVSFTVKACSTAGCSPATTISYTAPGGSGTSKGIVIPAYYALADAAKWQELATAAGQMAAANNPVVRDFWVVANYANGAFTTAQQWADAAARFNPIRSNGGKIFGYVYTHQAAYLNETGSAFDRAQFRDVNLVKATINQWVAGYPNLDGIWIDEFYPRHELATANIQFADYPNGLLAAPPGYRTPGLNLYATGQVEPAGGWFAELIGWIRATYPNLKIIGNAGGALYNNQNKYGGLPDVLVSFEQSQSHTVAVPADFNIDAYGFAARQLALIHGVATVADMQTMVAQAKAKGFTHIFATDGVYQTNLWTTNSSYLTQQVSAILAP